MTQVTQQPEYEERRHAVSKYGLTQTVLREEKYLVEALKEMGCEVEVHREGTQLNSYYAKQEAKVAHIVIRRQHLRRVSGQSRRGAGAPIASRAYGGLRRRVFGQGQKQPLGTLVAAAIVPLPELGLGFLGKARNGPSVVRERAEH
jgi:hypothetical protein